MKGKKLYRETLQQFIMFCEEIYSCNSQPAQYLKNKIDKDNFEKIHKKNMWGMTVAIHNVLKKKSTKLNSQPT